MPVSEKSIINPGQVQSNAPLKKSTVAWVIGIAMLLVLIGYYVPKMGAKTVNLEEPVLEKPSKATGSVKQIQAELKNAAQSASTPSPAAETPSSPLPVGNAPVLVKVPEPQPERRAGKNEPDDASLEMDSAARVSKSVTMDNSGISVGPITSAGGADELRASSQNTRNGVADADAIGNRPSIAEQLLKAQLSAKPAGDTNAEWLKEFADIKPTKAITARRIGNIYTLIQGKVIPAVLAKSLNSDLPGDITAITTVDVYDSLNSRYLLIPKGSVLIGEYSNRVRVGQNRMMFAFSRIVLPNGLSFDLPGNKGQDHMGMSGIKGEVDNHYFARFSSGVLIAILAAKLESNNQQPVTNVASSGPSTAAGQVLSEIAKSDLSRSRDIQPTITIPAGTRINVQVSADMEFPGAYRK
ncbi:MAG: TrbI/VirB10 family protein [Rhodoferax sp.]|nr:TrbI/VirB10 family protein [Rhodoferax sp.]